MNKKTKKMTRSIESEALLAVGPAMTVTKSGPQGVSVGGAINYQIVSTNTGDENLTNWSLEDIIPTEANMLRLTFNNGSSSSYNVIIRTSDAPMTDKQIITNATSPVNSFNLAFFTPPGEKVISIKITAPDFTPSTPANILFVTGTVVNTANVGDVLTNNVTNSATSSIGQITETASAKSTTFNKINGFLGEFVWNDLNGDGIYDIGVEPGINGVKVDLYDSTGTTLLQTYITSDYVANQPGYYFFANVGPGTYMLKFTPPAGYALTTQNLVFNGSTPNPATGFTNQITIEPSQTDVYINAGVVARNEGKIGNFVWNDLNGNGIYDVGEPGVNGVTVELYDQTGTTLLATTVTANNTLSQPGYYSFNNLTAGNYKVKFIPLPGTTLTIQNLTTNGSKPDPTTGFTNVITLAQNEVITDINAGILEPCAPPVINTTIYCAPLNSAYDPLKGVTATDCQGNNITNKVIVTQNTVNTEIVGNYSVTYEVTDFRNQTTTKTITVRVCDNGIIYQAITDLIESVALEQTAIAHIINAEGEKIQKVLQIGKNSDEILKTNNSVNCTIKAITKLEMALQQKLQIFKNSKGCCEQ